MKLTPTLVVLNPYEPEKRIENLPYSTVSLATRNGLSPRQIVEIAMKGK